MTEWLKGIGTSDKGHFTFTEAILYEPEYDRSSGLWNYTYAPFNIELFVEEKWQLHEELMDELQFLWDEYAMCDDNLLTDGAIALKRRLLAGMKATAP